MSSFDDAMDPKKNTFTPGKVVVACRVMEFEEDKKTVCLPMATTADHIVKQFNKGDVVRVTYERVWPKEKK